MFTHEGLKSPMPKLVIYKGVSFQKEYSFDDEDIILIGRGQLNDIVLHDSDRRISRQHAALVRLASAKGRYFLRDLGSTYCTRVGGQPIDRKLLVDGDVIQVGEYKLVYSTKLDDPSQEDLLRIVQHLEYDSLDASTVAAERLNSQAQTSFTIQQNELLEQVQATTGSLTAPEKLLATFMAPLLQVVRADQGFARVFRDSDGIYEDVGAAGLRRGEAIEISDHLFMDHLRKGEVVRERKTTMVPLSSNQGLRGFLCVARRRVDDPFVSQELSFLVAFAESVVSLGLGAECIDATKAAAADAPPPSLQWRQQLVGKTEKMRDLARQIEEAARAEMNVLLMGETGSGKEVVAKAIHQRSSHAKGPFWPRHCGQLTESLAEIDVFGYAAKSGISGANPLGAPGWFELANGGTLFMDEIQALSLAMQDKFLRVLQELEVCRYGGRSPVRLDLKIVAATSTIDLEVAIEEGTFRSALYYRFAMKLQVPPLRERKEDIPLLAYYFLDNQPPLANGQARSISRRALQLLFEHDWPGNVRELESCLKKAANRGNPIIFSWDLGLESQAAPRSTAGRADQDKRADGNAPKTMEQVEREKILEALESTHGNITRASELLGYKSRMTMLNKMDKYGVPRSYGDIGQISNSK